MQADSTSSTGSTGSPSAPSPSPADAQHMHELLTGFRTTQLLYVVAKLGVADLLAAGPKAVDELAVATGANCDALYRVLRALASFGVFAETAEHTFTLTPVAALLRQQQSYSFHGPALFFGGQAYQTWADLLHSVMTGETAYEHVFGMGHFAYLAQHPEESAIFNETMTTNSRRAAAAIVAAYDFSSARTVVDVAGGYGTLIAAVLRANPALRGILFDEEHVVAGASPLLQAEGVLDRCERVGGDFFAVVPPGADIYLLRHIIHDWDDDRSVTILRTCARALSPGGRVLVVEAVIEPGNAPSPAKLLDVQMLAMNGGRERTAEEYRRLFTAAGLTLTRIIPTAAQALIEGERA